MTESFLHYLWQFQYFDKKNLATTTGETLTVLATGFLNTDAGPDFLQAKIKIDAIEWVGSVEIHLQASGWYAHRHHEDAAYENVILHVVWDNTKPVFRKDGTPLPTLELKNLVDPGLITTYRKLTATSAAIPCKQQVDTVAALTKLSMIERAAMIRLEQKAKAVTELFNANQGDWEETTWQLLVTNFGFKTNNDPFAQLARALPYRLVRKHRHSLLQTEALLFGQAGFLIAKSKDTYVTQLYNEYDFLCKKYSLEEKQLHAAQWKFLRLRPANFPTLRLAQLAALVTTHHVFTSLLEAENAIELNRLFTFETSAYWKTHFRLGKKALRVSGFGEQSKQSLIINVLVPVLVAYGKFTDNWHWVDRAARFLQELPPEKNSITRLWQQNGINGKSAFESQGLLELYKNFCTRKACLNCAIGSAILKPSPV
ncbi:MAG: DUF2851 family protein [Cytophagales bacterium]|nr:DUF2851 family protein [Cytophagales bacterium]